MVAKKHLYILSLTNILLTQVHTHDNESLSLVQTTSEKIEIRDCQGEESIQLKLCINTCAVHMQKKAFAKLSLKKKKEYLKQLALQEYETFLDDYNEYDWEKIYQQLDDDEKDAWPKSIYDQRVSVDRMRKESRSGGPRYRTVTTITDKIPYAKSFRRKLESFFSDDEVKTLQKKFLKYMKTTFNL